MDKKIRNKKYYKKYLKKNWRKTNTYRTLYYLNVLRPKYISHNADPSKSFPHILYKYSFKWLNPLTYIIYMAMVLFSVLAQGIPETIEEFKFGENRLHLPKSEYIKENINEL